MARARNTTRALKAEFDVAHRQGMAALRRGDYPALQAAIQHEAELLAVQRDVIAQHIHRSEQLVQALAKGAAPPRRPKRARAASQASRTSPSKR